MRTMQWAHLAWHCPGTWQALVYSSVSLFTQTPPSRARAETWPTAAQDNRGLVRRGELPEGGERKGDPAEGAAVLPDPRTHRRSPGGSRRSHTGPVTARGTASGGCGPRRPAPRRPRAGPCAPAASASTRPAAAAATTATAPARPRRRQPSWPTGRRHVTALPAAGALCAAAHRAPEVGGEKAGEGGVP